MAQIKLPEVKPDTVTLKLQVDPEFLRDLEAYREFLILRLMDSQKCSRPKAEQVLKLDWIVVTSVEGYALSRKQFREWQEGKRPHMAASIPVPANGTRK